MNMRKLILAASLILASACSALAQSSPGLRTGQVPTAAQWNSYFQAKQDYLGFTPLNPSSIVASSPITTTIGGGVVTIACPTCLTGFANPTASVGLTAVNGSATTAMRSDGAPALSQAIVPTWTGVHTFTKTITLTPTPASLTAGISMNASAAGAPTTNCQAGISSPGFAFDCRYMSANVDLSGAPTQFGSGLGIQIDVGGAAAKGGWNGIASIVNVTSAMNAGDTSNPSFVGGYFVGAVLVPLNGTGTSIALAKGGAQGINAIAYAGGLATNLVGLTGIEVDVIAITGSSMAVKAGVNITTLDNNGVHGAVYEGALIISSGGTPWTNGILFADLNGANPFQGVGTLFKTQGAGSAASAIDVSSYTFSAFLFNHGNFTVTGAGAVAAASTVGGTAFQIGGISVLSLATTNYTSINSVVDGAQGIAVGNVTASNQNFYKADTHAFQTRAGAGIATLTSTGWSLTGTSTITSASASALAVGRLGATTPALLVDASTSTSITGIKVKSAASAGGVALAAIGETNVALTIDAAGSGTVTINGTGTGAISLARATTITTSVTVPLLIGGSGTTGTQLTLQTTSGNGTTDAFAFKGGNNGATTFATMSAGVMGVGINPTPIANYALLALSGTTGVVVDYYVGATAKFRLAMDASVFYQSLVSGTPIVFQSIGVSQLIINGTSAQGGVTIGTADATPGTGNLSVQGFASIGTKLRAVGTAPALTACGTTPAIVGSDLAGEVTMGTTATGCVITFNVAYATAPYCTVTWQATALLSQSYTVSATAITTVQTSASGNKLDYHCMARSGGFLLKRDLDPAANDNTPMWLNKAA